MANEVFNLQASIGLDISKFLDAMKTATSNIGNLKSDMDRASSNIENVQSSFDDASKSANGASSEIKAVDSRFAELNNRLVMAQIAVEDATDDVNYLRDAFNGQADSAGLADAKTKDYLYSLQQAEKDLQNAEKAEQAAQQALDAYNQSMDKSVESAEDTVQSSEDLAKSTENAGQAADEAGGSFLSFSDILKANVISDLITKGIEAAISQIEQLKSSIEGLATGFVDSVSGLAQFGDQIDKESQKIGISAKFYQEWDSVMRHSGTSISVVKAGMRTLRSAMESLGNATGESIVDQEKLTAAQTAYDNAVLSADKALLDYNSTVAKYGEESDQAISKLIALEKAQNGVESAQAKIDKAMQGSTPNMSDAASALNKLGIAATDAKGNLRDEEEVFKEVIFALQNYENETERARIAQQLFGRGGVEFGALLNTSNEDTEAMLKRREELNLLSDEAVKASARFQDSLQDMTESMTGMKNKLLQDFLPVFADVMDGVTDIFAGETESGKNEIKAGLENITETIEKSLPKVLEIGEQFMSLGDTLAPAIFKTFEMISDSIIRSIQSIDIDSTVSTLLDAIAGGADTVSRFFGSLGDLFVNGLDNLANSGGIERVISIVTDMVDKGSQNIVQILPKLSSATATIIEKLMQAVPDMLTGENASNLIDSLVDSVITIATAVANNVTPIAEAASSALPKIISALASNIAPVIDATTKIVTSLIDSIVADDGILDNIVDGVGKIVDAIVDNIDPILIAIQNASITISKKILEPDTFSKILSAATSIASKLFIGAVKALGSAGGFIVEFTDETIKMLSSVDWFGIVTESLSGIGKAIIGAFGIDMAEWDAYWEEIGSLAFDVMQSYADDIDEFKQMWQDGIDALEDFGGSVFDFISSIPEKFHEIVENAKKWGSDLIENFASGLKDNPIVKGVEGIAQGIKDYLGFSEPKKGALSNFHTYAPDMIDLFVSGINENKRKIDNALESAFELPEIENPEIDIVPEVEKNYMPETQKTFIDVIPEIENPEIDIIPKTAEFAMPKIQGQFIDIIPELQEVDKDIFQKKQKSSIEVIPELQEVSTDVLPEIQKTFVEVVPEIQKMNEGVFPKFDNVDITPQIDENTIFGKLFDGIKRIKSEFEDAFKVPSEMEYEIKRGFDVRTTESRTNAEPKSRGGVVVNFTQNNTSPEPMDEYQTWRQTQKAIGLMKVQLGV